MSGDVDDPPSPSLFPIQRELDATRADLEAFREGVEAIRAAMDGLSRSVVDYRQLPNVVALLALFRENQSKRERRTKD